MLTTSALALGRGALARAILELPPPLAAAELWLAPTDSLLGAETELLRQIQLHPYYPSAYAQLAHLRWRQFMSFQLDSYPLRRSAQLAEHALALDANQGAARDVMLQMIHLLLAGEQRNDVAAALADLERRLGGSAAGLPGGSFYQELAQWDQTTPLQPAASPMQRTLQTGMLLEWVYLCRERMSDSQQHQLLDWAQQHLDPFWVVLYREMDRQTRGRFSFPLDPLHLVRMAPQFPSSLPKPEPYETWGWGRLAVVAQLALAAGDQLAPLPSSPPPDRGARIAAAQAWVELTRRLRLGDLAAALASSQRLFAHQTLPRQPRLSSDVVRDLVAAAIQEWPQGNAQGLAQLFAGWEALRPGDPEFHRMCARAFLGKHHLAPETALDQLGKAAVLDPDAPDLAALHGTALLLSGRFHEAIEVLERALQLDPEHGETRQILACAHQGLGSSPGGLSSPLSCAYLPLP